MSLYLKDPSARLDYGLDWAANYLEGDTVIASSWSATPAGLTLSAPAFTATTTTVTVDGGEAGKTYRLVNQITTSAGRIDQRTLLVRIDER